MASYIPDDSKIASLETSKQNSHDSSAPGVVEDVVQVVDHQAERALCRRFDLRLLPLLALMCELSSYLEFYTIYTRC